MACVISLGFISVVLFFTVKDTVARDLRDPANSGLLLSALCIEDGQLRKSCLEDISTVSIQKFLNKVIGHINENQSLEDIINDVDDSDRSIDGESILPEKRGRSRNRNVSGFYSNWKRK